MSRILVINPNSSPSMTESIRRSATASIGRGATASIGRGATGAGGADHSVTVIRTVGAPPAIDTDRDEELAVEAMLALPELDHPDGFDALVIACFGDPGLDQLRERTGLPVIGMAQASMSFAANAFGSFGIVAASDEAVPIMERLVDAYGLGSWCRGVTATGVGVADLSADLDPHLATVMDRCTDLVEDRGAASICLGCSALGPAAPALGAALGRPVLDAVPLAVTAALTAALQSR